MGLKAVAHGVTGINGELGSITLTSSGATVAITTPTANTINLETEGGGGTPGGSSTNIQYNNAGAFGGFGAYHTTGSPLSSGAYVDLFGNAKFVADTNGDLRLGPASGNSYFLFNSSGFYWNDFGFGSIGMGNTYTSSTAILGLGADGSIGTETGTWAINGDGSGFFDGISWDTSGNLTLQNDLFIPFGNLQVISANINDLQLNGYTGGAYLGLVASGDPLVEFVNTGGQAVLQWGSVQGTAAGLLNPDGSIVSTEIFTSLLNFDGSSSTTIGNPTGGIVFGGNMTLPDTGTGQNGFTYTDNNGFTAQMGYSNTAPGEGTPVFALSDASGTNYFLLYQAGMFWLDEGIGTISFNDSWNSTLPGDNLTLGADGSIGNALTSAWNINANGSANFTNDLTANGLHANNGYTGTVTTSSLVGKTITIQDGIITGFA